MPNASACGADGRALPHLARSFPPRDRALLLGRLVKDAPGIEAFRDLFGDEREDYGAALQRHYANGPPPDWQERFVSPYASTHPWEDWAETWAHYFHMVDTLETASAFGMRFRPRVTKGADLSTAIDFDPHSADLDRIVDSWLPLTFAVNSINRSMGSRTSIRSSWAAGDRQAVVHPRSHSSGGRTAAGRSGRGALRAVIASMKRGVVSPDQPSLLSFLLNSRISAKMAGPLRPRLGLKHLHRCWAIPRAAEKPCSICRSWSVSSTSRPIGMTARSCSGRKSSGYGPRRTPAGDPQLFAEGDAGSTS